MPEHKICWRITRRCNLHCMHCLAGHVNAVFAELGREERLLVAEIVANVGLTRISWTGGEPTICPELPELLRVMSAAGVSNTLTTHGLNLRAPVLSALDKARDSIRFSFDGLRSTHNMIRRNNGFERTIAELRRLAIAGLHVEANLSLMRLNSEEVPELARQLCELGVEKIVVLPLLFRESAVDNGLAGLNRSEFERTVAELQEKLSSFPGTTLRVNDYHLADDSYIILESNGDIVLSSEQSGDKNFGPIVARDGTARLAAALEAHTLRHQTFVQRRR